MIDKELATRIDPKNVFLCGFSQGGLSPYIYIYIYIYHTFGVCKPNTTDIMMNMAGALTLASTLLYPKTLGGGAVFSGWVPFNSTSTIIEQITAEAKQIPILWSHGIADEVVLFEAGQAGPPFLQRLGINFEFKVLSYSIPFQGHGHSLHNLHMGGSKSQAYPGLNHSINIQEELKHVESWITSRL
ncbi:putative phospholipase/carboxylesterase/thioesterase, alpha/Beta hydrolase [Helianthus debilis subsp. tardiflorus]